MPAGIFYCWLSRLTFSLAALRTSVDRMLESYSYSERPPSVFQATHTAEVHPGASITAQIDTIYMAVAIRITRTSQALDGRTQRIHIHPSYGSLGDLSSPTPGRPHITFIAPLPKLCLLLTIRYSSATSPLHPAGTHAKSAADVQAFDEGGVRYSPMIETLDGGGGRGIQVVSTEEGFEEASKRCVYESPSNQLFAEKTLSRSGWKHIEVQISTCGNESSVQRRFQKVVERLAQADPVVCWRLPVHSTSWSNDGMHVVAPLTGEIIEMHPAVLTESEMMAKGDTIAALSMMKMECGGGAARGESNVEGKRR
ncbi:hypothetical protein FIBSPDRAFT_894200 [Athelia psychrophila]|uniref:Carbamoyl phosphate synthase ATP-binding domain-containing protein n=1 Tax=Athelia psychrophila TaxID=1759441 RepID=A0A166G3X0_9AGAM|nr:hypothetical protein FIBSPDRAFT_894200 [Fibularhizoctonia sp. CBS 109695]